MARSVGDFESRAVLPLAQAVVPVVRDLHITVGFEGAYKRAPSFPARFYLFSLSSIVAELKLSGSPYLPNQSCLYFEEWWRRPRSIVLPREISPISSSP